MFAWWAVVTSVWWNARPGKTGTVSSSTRAEVVEPALTDETQRRDALGVVDVVEHAELVVRARTADGHQRPRRRVRCSIASRQSRRPGRVTAAVTAAAASRTATAWRSRSRRSRSSPRSRSSRRSRLGLTGLRLPAIVLEILLGIAVGPQVLGWATIDEPVQVLSLIGLAFLLLLAGLEIDFDRLRGRAAAAHRCSATSISFGLALLVGFGLARRRPRPLAAPRSRSSSRRPGSAIDPPDPQGRRRRRRRRSARWSSPARRSPRSRPIVLLSLFFSGRVRRRRREARPARRLRRSSSLAVGVAILGARALDAGLAGARAAAGHDAPRSASAARSCCSRSSSCSRSKFGLEAILGAFLAGATLKLVDRDETMTHAVLPPQARGGRVRRLRSVLLRLDRHQARRRRASSKQLGARARADLPRRACSSSRGLPALSTGRSPSAAASSSPAGCCRRPRSASRSSPARSASSLGLIRPENYVALVAAGLLSVIVFPLVALTLLRGRDAPAPAATPSLTDACVTLRLCVTAVSTIVIVAALASAAPRRRSAAGGSSTVDALAYGHDPLRRHAASPSTRSRTTRRGKSACTGACAAAWPPVLVQAHPRAGAGREARRCSAPPAAPTARSRSPIAGGRSTTTSATASPARSSARTSPSSAASGSSSAPTGHSSGEPPGGRRDASPTSRCPTTPGRPRTLSELAGRRPARALLLARLVVPEGAALPARPRRAPGRVRGRVLEARRRQRRPARGAGGVPRRARRALHVPLRRRTAATSTSSACARRPTPSTTRTARPRSRSSPTCASTRAYNGYWFWGRPTHEELRRDMRAITPAIRAGLGARLTRLLDASSGTAPSSPRRRRVRPPAPRRPALLRRRAGARLGARLRARRRGREAPVRHARGPAGAAATRSRGGSRCSATRSSA